MPLHLIVNADDLGYCVTRDRGIFVAHAAGRVTSASLLITVRPALAAAALAEARRVNLDLGVHLNVTEGAPLLPPSQVPSLVVPRLQGDGQLEFRGKLGFRQAWAAGLIAPTELGAELEAQLAWFRQHFGGPPVHVDGHQHFHTCRGVPAVLAPLLNQMGIRWVRLAREALPSLALPPGRADFATTYPHVPRASCPFYQSVVDDSHAALAIYQAAGVCSTDAFMGMATMGRHMSADNVSCSLSLASASASASASGPDWHVPVVDEPHHPRTRMGSAVVEFMVHCGHPCAPDDGDDFSQSPERLHELQFLLSHEFSELLRSQQATLCSWRDLASLACPSLTGRQFGCGAFSIAL